MRRKEEIQVAINFLKQDISKLEFLGGDATNAQVALKKMEKELIRCEESPEMIKLWGRFGCDIEVTEEEYKILMESSKSADSGTFMKLIGELVKENRIALNGETYFPESGNFGSFDNFDNPEQEISIFV